MTGQPPNGSTSNTLAILSLISGLASLFAFAVFLILTDGPTPLGFAAALGLVAVIIGTIALRRAQSKGASITGIVCGAISLLASVALFVFALIFIGALSM